MSRRPRIGITMRLEIESGRFYLGRDYSEAIEAVGGDPVHLALIPKPEYIGSAITDLDGVLLPGSDSDVDPYYYGEEPHPSLKKVVPEKDETDRLVIEKAEELGLPILAICYGMQALNVARGGTLVQDIGSLVKGALKHEQGYPLARSSHRIRFDRAWKLADAAAKAGQNGGIRVNSHHHQSVSRLGEDLIAMAWSDDGVIESFQDARAGRFALGVQWHPELSWRTDAFSKEVFKSFIDICRAD